MRESCLDELRVDISDAVGLTERIVSAKAALDDGSSRALNGHAGPNEELEIEASRLRRQRDTLEAKPELVESLRAALDFLGAEHDSLLGKYDETLVANNELREARAVSAAELEAARGALASAKEQLAAARAEISALRAHANGACSRLFATDASEEAAAHGADQSAPVGNGASARHGGEDGAPRAGSAGGGDVDCSGCAGAFAHTDASGHARAPPHAPPTPATSVRALGSPWHAPAAAEAEAEPLAPASPARPAREPAVRQAGASGEPHASLPAAATATPPRAGALSARPEPAGAPAAEGAEEVERLERLIAVIMSHVNSEGQGVSMSRAAAEARAQLQLVGSGGASRSGWAPVRLVQPLDATLPPHLSKKLESERAAHERSGFFGWLFGDDSSNDDDDYEEEEEEDERDGLSPALGSQPGPAAPGGAGPGGGAVTGSADPGAVAPADAAPA